ncbi:MAG: heavy metal translocating P-type ATPase metal-binding domain-containing protein [Archangium sp.]|nr:heavy metal translocating P-type ATPase metal-binding domain-containing protein [Archangium sp.]
MRCEHCRSPIPPDAKNARFCCSGCETVHGLLREGGLDRFYALAGDDVSPAVVSDTERSLTWLEPLLPTSREGIVTLELDVQGIHCAACVWLMNEVFRRRSQHGEIIVNPTLGTVRLRFGNDFDVRAFVLEVERFGYQFGPPRKEAKRGDAGLALRLGISAALTINVMLFSLSFHLGLTRTDGEVFALFTWLSAALSTLTVAIGGWPFFRSAALSLRSGVLHLDVPIALGIALVYVTSLVQLIATKGSGDHAYFDTLNTFITLMLLGRFIQERVLLRNRRFLLEDDGADGLMVRVVRAGHVELVPAPRVRAGDELLVARGDVVPVDAELLGSAPALISMDWINGEAAPRRVTPGVTDSSAALIEAGSFNAGASALHARARQNFTDSRLVALLRAPVERSVGTHRHQQLWNAVAKRWVITVLGVSALGFLAWLPFSPSRALDVAVALLVITCPCAVGIAIPLAYELMQSRLRRGGFYSRGADLLDRLTDVRTLVFDKTGTLTLGRLELIAPRELEHLTPTAREIAFNLAVRSSHPVSVAIARALDAHHPRFDASAEVIEVPGEGMHWTRPDGVWRLGGRPTELTCNGVRIASLQTREVLRTDARNTVRTLGEKYALHLLSGDSNARVSALATELGISQSRAHGQLSPEEKGARVAQLEGVLFLGDGVNDSRAFEAALAAGTPAIDRPVMPSRSDFFLVGEGLDPLVAALDGAQELRRVVQRVLALSLAYNVFAIAFTLAGFMSPVAAAISMPASTLSLLAFTVTTLRRGQKRLEARTEARAATLPPLFHPWPSTSNRSSGG